MISVILKAGQYREPDAPSAAETLIQPLEGRSGYAFAFWQMKPAKEASDAFSGVLQDHVQRLASSFGVGANVQHRFEQFLRALNEALATQVKEGAWSIPIGHVHAFLGVACDGLIFFSGTGDLSALFLHRRSNGHYQVYNLFRSIQTEQALPSWEKTFAVVLDGDMHPGDVLCVSNSDVQRFLPADDLNRYLSTLPPASAAEKIRQHYPARTDLSLLILQAHDATPFVLGRAVPHSDVSVEHLADTASETERLLEDQGQGFFQAIRARFTLRNTRGVAGVKRPFGLRTLAAAKGIMRTLLTAMRWMGRVGKQLAHVRGGREFLRILTQHMHHAKERLHGRVHRVPRASRYLFVAAGALLIVLVVGITLISRSQTKTKMEDAYKAQVVTVQERRDQAAAAIIYRDEQKARGLYEEAQRLVDLLPTDTPEHTWKTAHLKSDIIAGLEQIRHVVNIPTPPLRADLGSVQGTALHLQNSQLYAFGADKRVYRFDPGLKAFAQEETTNGTVGIVQHTTSDDQTILLLDDRPGISRFDPEHRQLQVTDLKPASGPWADINLYGKRLFILSPGEGGDGQVLRLSKTDGGFGAPAHWIKSKTTGLNDAISIAIDGTLYVLKKNGTIVRFSNGTEMGWSSAKVEPPIIEARRVWTSGDSEYIYVLEPIAKRVIVYVKQSGAFISQYRSDAFDRLTDFAVDEKNRVIYLLSGSKLYSMTASHLK